jgi:hypothetical protein
MVDTKRPMSTEKSPFSLLPVVITALIERPNTPIQKYSKFVNLSAKFARLDEINMKLYYNFIKKGRKLKILFVTKPVKIVRDAKTLKIIDENGSRKIPIKILSSVYIFSKVELTDGARNLLLLNNKDIYFFTHKGEFAGVLHNAKLNSNYKIRLLQYKYINDLDMAKIIPIEIHYFHQYNLWQFRNKNYHKQVQTLQQVFYLEHMLKVPAFIGSTIQRRSRR